METTKSFRDLVVWQKAHSFVLNVYKGTEKFPKSEMFGLTSQLRRASVSIVANIVEGYKKKSKLDKLRFFNISQGSLEEARYYLILTNDLNYLDTSELMIKLEEVSKMLNSYCGKIIESKNQ
jgi:four helix bundle protein